MSFGDNQYVVDTILEHMGSDELTTREVAERMHMEMAEVWDLLLLMEAKGLVTKRRAKERWRWMNKATAK